MSKLMYLTIILSVVLIKSETSFGQTLKKELGICGKTMGVVLDIKPKSDPTLLNPLLTEADFCDNGRYEQEANFVIFLYNAKDQLVYDKRVFLSTLVVQETVDKKTGEFTKAKLIAGANSRIVKFPITQEMGEIKFYKIESLDNKKVYDKKTIKW